MTVWPPRPALAGCVGLLLPGNETNAPTHNNNTGNKNFRNNETGSKDKYRNS